MPQGISFQILPEKLIVFVKAKLMGQGHRKLPLELQSGL